MVGVGHVFGLLARFGGAEFWVLAVGKDWWVIRWDACWAVRLGGCFDEPESLILAQSERWRNA